MHLLINNIMPSQLLPCLAIPFVELFPDLCLGWWTPPSLDLKQYASLGMLRVLLQLIAWLPVVSLSYLLILHYSGNTSAVYVLHLCFVVRNGPSNLRRRQWDIFFSRIMRRRCHRRPLCCNDKTNPTRNRDSTLEHHFTS